MTHRSLQQGCLAGAIRCPDRLVRPLRGLSGCHGCPVPSCRGHNTGRACPERSEGLGLVQQVREAGCPKRSRLLSDGLGMNYAAGNGPLLHRPQRHNCHGCLRAAQLQAGADLRARRV